MKTLLILAVFALSVSHLAAADNDVRDGNWWKLQKPVVRAIYIIGFFDGSGSIIEQAVGNGELARVHESAYALIGSATAGQIAEGMDTFYKDFRNRSIHASDAFWVIVMSIRGFQPEHIEQRIMELRRQSGLRLLVRLTR